MALDSKTDPSLLALYEQGTAPGAVTNAGLLYTKETGGTTTLYFKNDAGTESAVALGSGIVDVTGTPVAGEMPYWNDANTLASDPSFTRASAGVYSLTTLNVTGGTLLHTPTHTMASANASVLNRGGVSTATVTLTGGTAIGSAAGANNVGFNVTALYQTTISSASATAVGVALTQAGAGFDGVPGGFYVENPAFTSAGGGAVTFPGGSYAGRFRNIDSSNALQAAASDVLCIERQGWGGASPTVPAAGFGPSILFRGNDASMTAGLDNMARIQATWLTATAGSEQSQIQFQMRQGGGGANGLATYITFTRDATNTAIAMSPGWIGTSATAANSALWFSGSNAYLNGTNNVYVNIDSGSASTARSFIVANNGTTTDGTALFSVNELSSVVCGSLAALAVSATDGFLYIPTYADAGDPSGTPTAKTGKVAIMFNTTTNMLNIYNGAWKEIAAVAV